MSSGRSARTAAAPPTPTVEAALDRFYRYLGEISGPGGQPRWQKVRELVADLRAMGDAGADALLRVLGSGASSDARRAAAQLAGELQLPQAQPLLQDILANDSDVLLRRAAASALRRLDTPDTVPAMETLLANPAEDRFVRMSAAYGLAQQGNPQGVNGLMQIFEESNADGRGREMAFRALTSLEDDRSLPFMRSLITSNAEPTYRLQAIRFLTAQGDRQALGALQQVVQSPIEQPSIHDAAVQAVAALTGQ
jgi:HEAT repeat protein